MPSARPPGRWPGARLAPVRPSDESRVDGERARDGRRPRGPSSSGAAHEPEPGARLAAQERRLRLLLAHLAGRSLRALARARGLPAPEPEEGALWRLLAHLARQVPTRSDWSRAPAAPGPGPPRPSSSSRRSTAGCSSAPVRGPELAR